MRDVSLRRCLLLMGYLSLFILVGLIVAYIGFCDPDTCWHLALGRWMWEHGQLPLVDPFSSNIKTFVSAGAGQPIMQHEWLSDCLFYFVYSHGGATALLIFVSVMSALALIVMPGFLLIKCACPRFIVILLLMASVPACLFRLWVRPEIFSFTFFSLLILLCFLSREISLKKYLCCLPAVFVLFALWANCHALFILGIFYMAFIFSLSLIEQCLFALSRQNADSAQTKEKQRQQTLRHFGFLIAAFCGTFCTPWQGALWFYIAKIVCSTASHTNKENGGMTFGDLGHITIVPLILSFTLAIIVLVRRRFDLTTPLKTMIMPLALIIAAFVMTIFFRRFTPFAMLMLLSSVGSVYTLSGKLKKTVHNPGSWLQIMMSKRSDIYCPAFCVLRTSIASLTVAGLTTFLAANFLIKPEIPSQSKFFKPACQAFLYLDKQKPAGRMLNESKLGSMLTFCCNRPPDIFIDGRFDSYSRQLISDYQTMKLAKPGYMELLRSYKIGWVFFPPGTPLVDSLEKISSWRICYRGEDAVILSKIADR